MNANAKLTLGLALLAIGLILPLGVVPLAQSGLPAVVKTLLGGFLFFGFEIMALPAAAIMGKENFERMVGLVKQWAGDMKPSGNVGKVRHVIGLVLFLLPLVPTYVMAYAPAWLPDHSPERLWVSIGADLLFLVSLFVLGGDFWDKLGALFVRDARAVFPGHTTSR